jgi:hypothetical protein
MYDFRDSEYNDIQRMVGLCHQTWSYVEVVIHSLFAVLNNRLPAQDGMYASFAPDPLLASFAALRSFGSKLTMIDRYVEASNLDRNTKDAWHSIRKKLEKSSQKRNEIAHFAFLKHWNGPVGVGKFKEIKLHPFSTPFSAGKDGLTSDQLFDRAIAFHNVSARVGRFVDHLLISTGRQPLDPDSLRYPDHLLDPELYDPSGEPGH